MFSKKADTLSPTLDELIKGSNATDQFKNAVLQLEKTQKPVAGIIETNSGAPGVKVLRTMMQLLDQENEWEIARVKLEGRSGCSDFRGELFVDLEDGTQHHVQFIWDCAWKAQEEGYKTFWGDPDQQKAAQMFGYKCFEKFEIAE